jgi:hypothetical protein
MLLNAPQILAERLIRPAPRLFDVHTELHHFALINYALPKLRLQSLIPTERFLIPEFDINGQTLAMMSVVPFVDVDFRFARLAPFLAFAFPQTNYRVYLIDKTTGEHVVWFLGTTLGSHYVNFPRLWWRIPWHYGRYQVDCRFDARQQRYWHFAYQIQSDWGTAQIHLEHMGEPLTLQPGFASLDEMVLILTHPVTGFYYRLNGKLGSYTVWHDLIPLTTGRAKHLYFSRLETLGLLSLAEMQQPHSIFICPQIAFDIHLPPQKLT